MKAIYLLGILILFAINGRAQVFEYVQTLNPDTISNTSLDQSFCVDVGTFSDLSVVQVGSFKDTIDLDPGPSNVLAYSTTYAVFIQKLDSSGNLIWAKTIDADLAFHVEIDALDNIYVIGAFSDTVDFDPDPVASHTLIGGSGNTSGFFLKLNSMGDFIWVRAISHVGIGVTSTSFSDAKVDHAGNIYAIGNFAGTIDFDPGPGVVSAYTPVMLSRTYIVKLDSSGNFSWARTNTAEDLHMRGFAVDSMQNVYIAGLFQGTVDFDYGSSSYNVTAPFSQGAFLQKLDINGDFVWTKTLTDNVVMSFASVVDDAQNIYWGGVYQGSIDANPGSGTFFLATPPSPFQNLFTIKLTNAGNFIWAKSYGTSYYGGSVKLRMTKDRNQNIYTAAPLNDFMDLDPGTATHTTTTNTGSFVQILDSAGSYVNGLSYAGYFGNIAVSKKYEIYMNGDFIGVVDFDPDPLIDVNITCPYSSSSGYLLKLSQGGCPGFHVSIDSLIEASCAGNGIVFTHAVGGLPPYHYEWETTPIVTDSTFVFDDTSGVYKVNVTDSLGCIAQRWIHLSAPLTLTDFDAQVNLIATPVRIGFQANANIYAGNSGCLPATGQIKFRFSDTSLISYDSIVPVPDFISGDTLIWNYTGLIYGESILNKVYFHPSTLASFGDSLLFYSWITPTAGDINTSNNSISKTQIIINGYDPNIKSVYPQGDCPQHYVLKDQTMTYTVQFQNTGNADAINIYIIDSLDSDLDLSTLQILDKSHDLITEVLPGNILKFVFNDIYLPDSASNEPASHGHVIYTIDQNPSLPDGTMLTNTAYIYFDSNPAIVTNTVFNTVVDEIPACALSVNETPQEQNSLVVYPNPATQTITVISKGNLGEAITIYDVYGRLIKQLYTSSHITTIDINGFSDGVYVIHCSNQTSKFIKR